MTEDNVFIADYEESVDDRKLPAVFTNPPERISHPRSPFKVYVVFDYDMASEFLANANARVVDVADYVVVLDEVCQHDNNSNFLFYCATKALKSGGLLYMGEEYKDSEFIDGWKKGRKEKGYVPYTKP